MVFKELHPIIRFTYYIILLIASISIIYPLFWMTYTSLKTNEEVIKSPFGLPSRISFDNINKAWETGNFSQLYVNSLFITILSVIGVIILATMAAYALARYKFQGDRFIFFYFLIGMAVPTQALMVPSFKLMSIYEKFFRNS